MKILVTGCNGYIGSHLLRSLEVIDDFRGGKYYEVGGDLKYKTKSNVSINGLLYYQYIPEIIGNGHYYYIGNRQFFCRAHSL